MTLAPPEITGQGWGWITADGRRFKDVMLWPGGARAWDWRDSGTDHQAGVQATDVASLLDHGARHVVLSSGRQERLRIHDDAVALLEERGIAYDVLPTGEAIDRYERLRAGGAAVGALIHTTC